MAAHSSILAWRILWTEEPGGATVHRLAKSQTPLATKQVAACETWHQKRALLSWTIVSNLSSVDLNSFHNFKSLEDDNREQN